jgi:hypothetical protein
LIDSRQQGQIAYGDGVITSRNTFQKYYEQEELKIYIDQVLSVDAIPVALGIYFVFRDAAEGEGFRASRFRSHLSTPRVRSQVKRFEDYAEMLAPLMAFVSDRGRLPVKGELAEESAIKEEFHSFNRAWRVFCKQRMRMIGRKSPTSAAKICWYISLSTVWAIGLQSAGSRLKSATTSKVCLTIIKKLALWQI